MCIRDRSNTGQVTSPASDVTVTLTATITKGQARVVKSFVVTVRKLGGMIAHYTFDGNLGDTTGAFGAGAVTGAKIDVGGGSLGYEAGMKGSAAVFNGASGVRLPNGLIASNTYTVAMWLKPAQLTAFSTTFFGARNGDSWISLLPKGMRDNDTPAGAAASEPSRDGIWPQALRPTRVLSRKILAGLVEIVMCR